MFIRHAITIFFFLFAKPAAALTYEPLDDLMTPDEIAQELDLGTTDYSPQVEPLSPAQILEAYGVDVYAEFPVVMVVSKGSQTAMVYQFGTAVKSFPVSTGREKMERAKSGRVYFTSTPSGWYSPQRYVRNHYSTTWEANMEYSIFFNGGIAVHATTPDHYKDLGRRASGGCVRLHKANAAWFWTLSLAYRTANVPSFTRGGQIIKNRDGSVKRHMGSGTLIIVTSY